MPRTVVVVTELGLVVVLAPVLAPALAPALGLAQPAAAEKAPDGSTRPPEHRWHLPAVAYSTREELWEWVVVSAHGTLARADRMGQCGRPGRPRCRCLDHTSFDHIGGSRQCPYHSAG